MQTDRSSWQRYTDTSSMPDAEHVEQDSWQWAARDWNQMEICSLIDTSRYKPHWQRRWQRGETCVEALCGAEFKKKNAMWKGKHDTNHICLKKKNRQLKATEFKVSGSELLQVHNEKLQPQLFSTSLTACHEEKERRCKQIEVTHSKEPLARCPDFITSIFKNSNLQLHPSMENKQSWSQVLTWRVNWKMLVMHCVLAATM